MVLAFDIYIKENKIIGHIQTQPADNLDVDIAYGYENVDLETVKTDVNLKNIISQINLKYSKLVKGKTLQTIEVLELKNGKLNYKVIYMNPATHLTIKFMVYYNPVFEKVLLLNPINLPSSQQF